MNGQIYTVVKELNEGDINEDRGAFFNSIIGTLNHILVADLIWLTRFSMLSERYVTSETLSDFPTPNGLGDILFSNFTSLLEAREKLDLLIRSWLNDEIRENDFNKLLEYSNTKGVVSKRDFGELVSHLFNHQTHHRWQLSTLLNQMKHDIGTTDFLLEIPNKRYN